ncbi:EamA family transporter [Candidatus Amarobacter glycogenicus]|uniref:EamA family transporter n=1 Tax=Candidatus Amarobacter glycogenicus TaxID=3140699 RepID=UPI002A0E1900|nr:EamA family transporter [Dehalococcoidia bacterium]
MLRQYAARRDDTPPTNAPAMLIATILALGAAVLHASWNLALKQGGDRYIAASLQFLFGGLLFLPVLLLAGPPRGEALIWLAASTAIHFGYVTALTRAYHSGDFSMTYPLARGSGALIAATGGAVLLGDTLPPVGVAGMLIAAVGLLALMQLGGTREAYAWALATGLLIATYTLVDTQGSRASNGLGYAAAQGVSVGVALSLAGLAAGRGQAIRAAAKRSWKRYAAAGGASVAAYGMVLVAVNHAPVGYVAVLRETSVILGPIGGWLFLREGLGRHRAIAAVIVLVGICVLIAAR